MDYRPCLLALVGLCWEEVGSTLRYRFQGSAMNADWCRPNECEALEMEARRARHSSGQGRACVACRTVTL